MRYLKQVLAIVFLVCVAAQVAHAQKIIGARHIALVDGQMIYQVKFDSEIINVKNLDDYRKEFTVLEEKAKKLVFEMIETGQYARLDQKECEKYGHRSVHVVYGQLDEKLAIKSLLAIVNVKFKEDPGVRNVADVVYAESSEEGKPDAYVSILYDGECNGKQAEGLSTTLAKANEPSDKKAQVRVIPPKEAKPKRTFSFQVVFN